MEDKINGVSREQFEKKFGAPIKDWQWALLRRTVDEVNKRKRANND